MSLPNSRAAWIALALLVIAALGLYQIYRPINVVIHSIADSISFATAHESEMNNLPLIDGLSMRSLNFSGLSPWSFYVTDLRQGGRSLVYPETRIILKGDDQDSELTLEGEGLRLMVLSVISRTKVRLYTDLKRNLLIRLENPQGSEIRIGVLAKFTLKAKNVTIVNADTGKEIISPRSSPEYFLEVVPSLRNFVLEQRQNNPLFISMDLGLTTSKPVDRGVPIGISPRFRVSHLDFTEERSNKAVSAIKELWIEPLISKDNPTHGIFLKLKTNDVFTLQSLVLTQKGLECELTGHTDYLMVGNDETNRNLVPSILESLVNHRIFRLLCKPLGAC